MAWRECLHRRTRSTAFLLASLIPAACLLLSGCETTEESVTRIEPYDRKEQPRIARAIRDSYEIRFGELDRNSQAHFAVRIFRATGATTDLRAVAMDMGRWVYDLQMRMDNLNVEGFIEQQSRMMHAQKREISSVLRSRKDMFASRKDMLFHRRVLYVAYKIRDYGMHKGPFRDYYEAALKHLQTVNFAGFLLDPEVIRTYAAQTSNLVFWLKRIDVADLEEGYTRIYKDVFMNADDGQLDAADYQNKLYGLTHFIIGDSHYYQRTVSAEKHAWILEYFDRHILEILSWSKPDIVAEIALCFRLCGRHDHRVVRLAEEYLAKAFDPALGYIPSATGETDFGMAEHRNAVAYLVLSDWKELHEGPHLDESAVLAFVPIDLLKPAKPSQLPIRGKQEPKLAAFDRAMTTYMQANDISAGLLGVMKDGKIVLERSYGWSNAERTDPLKPRAVMRIASVTKPFTAACIRRMADAGKISLDDLAFDLGQQRGGLLQISPHLRLGDQRLKNVTVRHLLEHTAGWNPDIAADLTFRELDIVREMGVSSPPGRLDMARWILAHPLQHTPGHRRVYSNEGYFFLGLIVEKMTNRNYMDYLVSEVLEPAGIPSSEIFLGRTLRNNRNEREPWYDSRAVSPSVFPPGKNVERAYGGWSLENHFSAGGLVASPRGLLGFLKARYIIGSRIGLPRKRRDSGNWLLSHTGKFTGTSALARQRGDGIHFAVIFNKAAPDPGDYGVGIRMLLDQVIDKHVKAWPK